MKQEQFFELWKTLYDIFSGLPDEQRMYHCVASLGTTLLKIGELSFQQRKQAQELSSAKSPTSDTKSLESFDIVSQSSIYGDNDSQSNVNLSYITFDQFQAAFFIEESLVNFFEKKPKLSEAFQKPRSARSRSSSNRSKPDETTRQRTRSRLMKRFH